MIKFNYFKWWRADVLGGLALTNWKKKLLEAALTVPVLLVHGHL
jgi:hypothetical protein